MVFPRRGYQSGRGVETVDCGPWTVGVPKGTRSGNRMVDSAGGGYQKVSILEWTKNVHFRWARMDILAASSEGCTVQRGLRKPF